MDGKRAQAEDAERQSEKDDVSHGIFPTTVPYVPRSNRHRSFTADSPVAYKRAR
jgi:hypothetical protein